MKSISIYIRVRTGTKHYIPEVLSWKQEQAYMNRTQGDYLLHSHYTDKLFKQIQQEHMFYSELKRYKDILKDVNDFCSDVFADIELDIGKVSTILDENDYITLNPAPFGEIFTVSHLDCLLMQLYTKVFRHLFAVRQYPQLCDYPEDLRYPEACSPLHPTLKIPLGIFQKKSHHMSQWNSS